MHDPKPYIAPTLVPILDPPLVKVQTNSVTFQITLLIIIIIILSLPLFSFLLNCSKDVVVKTLRENMNKTLYVCPT